MFDEGKSIKQWTRRLKEITIRDANGRVIDKKMVEATPTHLERGRTFTPGTDVHRMI